MPRARRASLLRFVAGLALLHLCYSHEGAEVAGLEGAAQAPGLSKVYWGGAGAHVPSPPVSLVAAASLQLGFTEGELGCDDVTKLDAGDDLCAFVRSHCRSEGLVNYPQLYYCHVAPHGRLLKALMLLGCIALLALLFRIIGRAADDFFSCILSQISQDLGLPPRLGGVTLLALGNGAPDLSASIAAVKTGNYQLAMGALTGAGMFVGAVVAGRIVSLSGGVRARGAQLRDICTQFITVVVVTGIVASGWFTYGGVAVLLSIYATYVVVVAVADFSKRAGVEWGEVARKVSRRMSGRWRVEMVSPLLQSDHGSEAAAGDSSGSLQAASSGSLSGRVANASRQQQETILEERPLEEGEASANASLFSSVRAALTPLAAASSLPLAAAGPGSLDAAGGVTAQAGAQPSRYASLPDFQTAQRQQQLHAAHRHLHHHARHGPPVAHFEPRVAYSDLVQMPAKEYRQRALAEMAQSTSFFVRDRRDRQAGAQRQGSMEEEEEEEEWEASGSSDEDLEEGYRRSAPQHEQHGRLGSGEYHPPAISPASPTSAFYAAAGSKAAEAGAVRGVPRQLSPQHRMQQQRPGFDHQSSGQSRPSSSSPQLSMSSFEMMATTEAAAVAEVDFEARAAPAVGAPAGAPYGAWEAEAASAGEGSSRGIQAQLMRVLEAVQWPVLVLLQATIPLVEMNSYNRRWFLRSLAASPLFIVAYLELFTWQAVLVAACAGAALAAAGHLGTRHLQGKAPVWTLGTGYPIGAALVAVYGFAVAAMWISLFASEIVGLLQFFGLLSKVDSAVLGVTVLAWGNSLMDYVNNTAMAGRSAGGNSMAMTACFAGPLFNMLVGLGLGFWSLLGESGASKAAVEMDPVVLVGCLFIMLNGAGLVGVSLTHRMHLPAWCGYAMVAWYCAYLAVVLAVIIIT